MLSRRQIEKRTPSYPRGAETLAGHSVGKDDAGVFIASCSTPESSFRSARSSNVKKSQVSDFQSVLDSWLSIAHLEIESEGRGRQGNKRRNGAGWP